MRAPVGVFVPESALADPAMLDEEGAPLPFGDPRGIAVSLPRFSIGAASTVLRAWYWPAVVVSLDCDIDKQPGQVLLAPIMPLEAFSPEEPRHLTLTNMRKRSCRILLDVVVPPQAE